MNQTWRIFLGYIIGNILIFTSVPSSNQLIRIVESILGAAIMMYPIFFAEPPFKAVDVKKYV